jgi:diketogulonate reductase-like aldo/keto reductase
MIDQSLEKLQLDYVDLLMMHGPGPWLEEPFTKQACRSQEEFDALPRTPEGAKRARVEVWRAFQDSKKKRKVKHLGVSNFTRFHLEQIINDPRYV